ncbi:hypothetical protein L596_005134 [Steinernema carpocapsae]|uniref:Uncharacterized protein n=1 Tax=Steinernema carpocapsae TaxID=34508 RepID=A0A4U8V294_STECR|nr:hypothetical protein L596_005134 [Steinernema carpocapsae]
MSLVAVGTLHSQENARREVVPLYTLHEDLYPEELPETACEASPRPERAEARVQVLQQKLRLRRESPSPRSNAHRREALHLQVLSESLRESGKSAEP